MIRVLQAAHLSYLVQSPWEERGGLLFIASPGTFKTTMIRSLTEFSEAICLGDINVKSLIAMRDEIMGGRYRTLAFEEMEKLYARNPATAANIEAHIRQFVEQGVTNASFEDARMVTPPARCLVIAGLTPSLYGKKLQQWIGDGFLRRFLVCTYILSNEQALVEAVHQWQKIDVPLSANWNGQRAVIKYNLEPKESSALRKMVCDQHGSTTPFVLLKKIGCVLKHREPETWLQTIQDFAPCLRKGGALLEI